MKKFIQTILLLVLPSVALSGNGYTCFMPMVTDPPGIEYPYAGFDIRYFVYNGTGIDNVENDTLSAYHNLVSGNKSFSKVHQPRIMISNNLNEVTGAMELTKDPKRWHTVVVIGDIEAARQLQEENGSLIAFVPSEQVVEYEALQEIKAITKKSYYEIAVDHAIRRVTRMATGLDTPGLSTITVNHIISDIRFTQ